MRRYVAEKTACRVLAFLNISSIGLASAGLGGDAQAPGELESLKYADVDGAVKVIESNQDLIVGVKIRLSDTIAHDGDYEEESLRRAMTLAIRTDVPLMVHHAFSTLHHATVLQQLREGDIYTHCFHGFPSTIVDPTTQRVSRIVKEAYNRGVFFDVGSGQGSFNWTVAEIALSDGIKPHIISTDLHTGTIDGPTYDLPTVMTRFLNLGLSLSEVIERVTIAPARAIGWENIIGTLSVDRPADITALTVEPTEVALEDCQSQLRTITRKNVVHSVWRNGKRFACTQANPWPNPISMKRQRPWWDRLVVRDDTPPPPV